MIEFAGKAVLLDIEGTTSSIRFVYDVLFPYARAQAADFLQANWSSPAVRDACTRLLEDASAAPMEEGDAASVQQCVLEAMHRLMDADVKATGLKELQGLIWDGGYRAGKLQSHLYDDVHPVLMRWRERGLDVRIYSSGSVAAQKAFFGHTEKGDLLPLFAGHYDTHFGAKREADSYCRIARDMKRPAGDILFLSDVPAELDAARAAGMQTGLVVRPGNAPVDESCSHPRIDSFAQVHLTRSQ